MVDFSEKRKIALLTPNLFILFIEYLK